MYAQDLHGNVILMGGAKKKRRVESVLPSGSQGVPMMCFPMDSLPQDRGSKGAYTTVQSLLPRVPVTMPAPAMPAPATSWQSQGMYRPPPQPRQPSPPDDDDDDDDDDDPDMGIREDPVTDDEGFEDVREDEPAPAPEPQPAPAAEPEPAPAPAPQPEPAPAPAPEPEPVPEPQELATEAKAQQEQWDEDIKREVDRLKKAMEEQKNPDSYRSRASGEAWGGSPRQRPLRKKIRRNRRGKGGVIGAGLTAIGASVANMVSTTMNAASDGSVAPRIAAQAAEIAKIVAKTAKDHPYLTTLVGYKLDQYLNNGTLTDAAISATTEGVNYIADAAWNDKRAATAMLALSAAAFPMVPYAALARGLMIAGPAWVALNVADGTYDLPAIGDGVTPLDHQHAIGDGTPADYDAMGGLLQDMVQGTYGAVKAAVNYPFEQYEAHRGAIADADPINLATLHEAQNVSPRDADGNLRYPSQHDPGPLSITQRPGIRDANNELLPPTQPYGAGDFFTAIGSAFSNFDQQHAQSDRSARDSVRQAPESGPTFSDESGPILSDKQIDRLEASAARRFGHFLLDPHAAMDLVPKDPYNIIDTDGGRARGRVGYNLAAHLPPIPTGPYGYEALYLNPNMTIPTGGLGM